MTKITQLPVASTISDTGVFVIVDEGVTKQLSWQTLKNGGLKGDKGTTGTTGIQGPVGPTGTVATIVVGTVSVSTGTDALITASTSTVSSNITILDFVVPQGPQGETGVVSWSELTNNMIPGADAVYSIGSPENRWKDLYLSNGTLYLGDTVLSGTVSTTTVSITSATTEIGISSSSFEVDDGAQVKVGSKFYGLPGQGDNIGVVTNVVGNTISFSPSLEFTPTLTPPYPVDFISSGGVLVDGSPFGYSLPVSTTSELGGVKVGSGIDVDEEGTISVYTGTPYVLQTATSVELGGVKIGIGINIADDGTISVTTGSYALQTATSVVLGGVKIGTGIDVSSSGTISVSTSVSLASTLTGEALASNVTSSSIVSLGNLIGLTVSGTSKFGQITEKFNSISSASGLVSHDCSNATIFVHNTPTNNFTANFTNVSPASNEVVSFALLINQGATPYIPSSVQVNSTPQTIKWQGGITPTGNANKVDLVNFTAFLSTGTAIVLGSLSSYG